MSFYPEDEDLWKQQLDWDEIVPPYLESEFRVWESELQKLNEVKIPRWTHLQPNVLAVQLCGFADASSSALGCVIYMRTEDSTGGIHISYLMAKSKVAPIKAVTIARLELVAALVLSKLVTFIRKALVHIKPDVHLWTDSLIVLVWLNRPSYEWKTYVRNRIQQIQELTSDCSWHHIQGVVNPADIHSRVSNSCYLYGPVWLKNPIQDWPVFLSEEPKHDDLNLERVQLPRNSLPTVIENSFLKYSNDFCRCLTIAAYGLRWLNKTFPDRVNSSRSTLAKDSYLQESNNVTLDELRSAEDGLMRYVQWIHFPLEYASLNKLLKLPKGSKLAKYKPVWDKDRRLIVASGRLSFSHLHPEAKRPVILPPSDRFVDMLVLHCHQSRDHIPQDHTISVLRLKYPILRCRQVVLRVLNSCITCRHYKAPPIEQQMGDLPDYRVGSIVAPFNTIGLDYTGVIVLRAPGGKRIKCYILIATCAQTRMCHLELTTGMSTEEILGALRRIVNRRGVPNRFASDNAKYFIKCSEVLRPEIQKYASFQNIEWEFIVERGPHRGALWERLIRSIKEPLRKVIGIKMVTWNQMLTLLSDIERHLNSRPLTYSGSDPNNPVPLTLAHLCLGKSLEPLQEAPLKLKSLDESYQHQQQILKEFWRRSFATLEMEL